MVTKRETVLQLVKVAGYHNDSAAGVRLLVENPISRKVYNEAWASGQRARESGVPCSCYQCRGGA